jgi:Holliday junction resolvase RusA-like endonuclease
MSTREVGHFSLAVPGPVRGQGRPRFNRATGHAHTDAKSRSYAQRIEEAWYRADCPALPERSHYTATVVVSISRPEGHYRVNGDLSAAGSRRPYPGKPDLDNCVKWLDALVACGAIPDDLYLVGLLAKKEWCPAGEDTLWIDVRAQ